MRPIFHLWHRMRATKARKAAKVLNEAKAEKYQTKRVETHTRLCVEMGLPASAWRGKGR